MPLNAIRHIARDTLYIILMITMLACSSESRDSGEPIIISGTVQYEDRLYNNNGFTGETEFKPVRYARVELVDAYDRIVASTETDEMGFYQVNGTGHDVRVRVLAQSGSLAPVVIKVHDYDGNIYAISQAANQEGGERQMDIEISLNDTIAGAYNMLDVFSVASEFIETVSSSQLPELNSYWEPGRSRYGTYFCPTDSISSACPRGKGIYVLGGSSSGGDTDQYDDDVLYHEYAHYLENSLGINDSPGGVHYLTANDMDIRLTWSEGFGGFFPTAVKAWLNENNVQTLSTASSVSTSQFIDTYGSSVGISINIAEPGTLYCGGVDCFVYSSSEIAVAKVLAHVNAAFNMQSIWDVLSAYMATETDNPATIESFWDGWLNLRAPSVDELSRLNSILADRLIYFTEDEYEQNNSVTSAQAINSCLDSSCTGLIHYLYRDTLQPDVDTMSVEVTAGTSYTIETFDLSNAADTYIRLLDADGIALFASDGSAYANDDREDTVYCYPFDNPCRIHYDETMLSSSLRYIPTASHTLFIEVTSSPSAPSGAGRYGSYKFRIYEN